VCFLDFYTTQILTSTTLSIECISCLIKELIHVMPSTDRKIELQANDIDVSTGSQTSA
jgi:hypothetical protein